MTYNKTVYEEKAPVNIRDFRDELVFDLLYKRYWEALLQFSKRYITDNETCKEIVQELFVTLHIKRNKLAVNISISSYLFGALRNMIINHLRNESVYKKHLSIAGNLYRTITTCNEAELWMDAHDLEKQIAWCLKNMPCRYRDVYLLVIENMCPVKKAAEILQRPVGTIQRQLRVSIRLLREHLSRN